MLLIAMIERPQVLLPVGLIGIATPGGVVLNDITKSAIPLMLFVGAIIATAAFTWAVSRAHHSKEARLKALEAKMGKLLNETDKKKR